MSSSKSKASKSKKKKSSKSQPTPLPNPLPNPQTNVYRPEMLLEDPMFSPTQFQIRNQNYVGYVPNFYSQPQAPGYFYNIPSPMESQTQTPTPTPPETQVPETQFMSSQPRRLVDSDTEEEEEEEEQVEEAEEEEPPTQDVRGKGKARAKPQAWTVDEVKALAQTWIDISEDAATGNNQDTKAFTERIWTMWCARMGRQYRNSSQLYSKWRNVSKIAKEFEGIFDQATRNWPSGATVDDVMADARVIFNSQSKVPFGVGAEAFWRAIRGNEKWRKQKSFHEFAISKRTKTSESTHSQSSDANIGFDMNADPDDERLPIGRDQTKRKMRRGGGSSSTQTSQSSADIVQLQDQIENLKTLYSLKEQRDLIKIAATPISHLTGADYQISLEAKKDAARKLGYKFDDI